MFSAISSEESLRFIDSAADEETKAVLCRLTNIDRQILPDNEGENFYEKAS